MVVAAIGDQAVGAQPRPADSAASRPDAVDGQQLGDDVAVAAGQRYGQRDAGRVD